MINYTFIQNLLCYTLYCTQSLLINLLLVLIKQCLMLLVGLKPRETFDPPVIIQHVKEDCYSSCIAELLSLLNVRKRITSDVQAWLSAVCWAGGGGRLWPVHERRLKVDFPCLHHTYAACLRSRILYSTEIALEAQFADPLTHGGECYCRVGVWSLGVYPGWSILISQIHYFCLTVSVWHPS